MRAIAALLMGTFFSMAALAAPSWDDIRTIKARFLAERLTTASVEFAPDGRIKLTGQYRDRAEVQFAFMLAQQVAGVRWVAPTTPENVRYPGTEGMKSGILEALKKSRPPLTTAGPRGEGERYALVVGVGHYVNKKISAIPNASDDAKLFFGYLESRKFKRTNITLLLEEQATKQNVSLAMRSLTGRVKADDTVILYFSTHGSPPNELGNVPIVLHDTEIDAKRRWVEPTTALQDDEIKQFIEAVSPARVMVVLDVCYSGGAFAKIPGMLASTSKDLFVEESNFTTGVSQTNLNYLAGAKHDQEKILIAASGPGEKSWNSSRYKQGYFTYHFVNELKGTGDAQRAFLAAKPIVQSDVRQTVSAEQHTEVNQTPQATFMPETANVHF